jgi:AbrB family looped-hinge helix DNA binding protein
MPLSSIVDQKRRIVLPAEVTEELDLHEGSEVAFEKRKGSIILRKARVKKGRKKKRNEDPLGRAMSWNPPRSGKPLPVVESEIKEIWRS